jgi:hypothetical protein
MKAKIILGLLVVGLMANGSSCLNDPFIVPLNAPLKYCDATNPGGSWGDDGPVTVPIIGLIPESYQDAVVGARLVDVVVYAVNPDTGARVTGDAGIYVGGVYRRVVSFDGTGAQFAERRSLLRDQSPLITADPTGIAALENLITQFINNPQTTTAIVFSQGTVSPPVQNQEICVEILVQVDGEVSID